MKKIFIIIGLIIISFSLHSQEINKITKKQLLGINLGATTGIGFSYKQWQNDVGFQITGLPVKVGREFDFSIGFTGFYSFNRKRLINFFAYSGVNYMTTGFDFIFDIHPMYEFADLNRENNYYDPVSNQYIYSENDENYLNFSAGIGAELGKNPLFTAMIGYAAYDLTQDYKLFPTIELGLHFNINNN